jgi:hypothetical protein
MLINKKDLKERHLKNRNFMHQWTVGIFTFFSFLGQKTVFLKCTKKNANAQKKMQMHKKKKII